MPPVPVCRTSDLSEAGAFWTQDVAGTPLLVTRDAHEVIRAFVNLCRHRGVRLVHERHGITKTFTCLLHGWTYGADGQMGGSPLARLAQTNPMLAAIRDNNVLTPLAFELRHGFVWVSPRGPIDVAGFLGPIDAALEALNASSFIVKERDETDRMPPNALSEDVSVVVHRRSVEVFTLVRRRAEEDWGEPQETRVERLVLAPA